MRSALYRRLQQPRPQVRLTALCVCLAGMFLAGSANCFAEDPDASALSQKLENLYQAGKYREAIPLAQQVLAYNEKMLGPNSPQTATSLNNLAELYRKTGDYAKAEPIFEKALQVREKVFGADNAETASSLNMLASLYEDMGDYAKAQPLLEHSLAIRERVEGPDNVGTASALNNLALAYNETGDYAKAEPLFQRALRINEKVFGPDHPNTAICLHNLATLYQDTASFGKAEPLLERALRIDENTFGPQAPETASILNNLAEFYCDTGQSAKAEPLLKRALNIRENFLGPQHLDTGVSLNNLGRLYEDRGDYARAKPLLERALTIFDKVRGPEHPDTAASLSSLADLHQLMGDYAKAGPLYQRAVTIREKVYGTNNRITASSYNSLALLYKNMGNYAKAEPLLRKAIDILDTVLGPEHPDTAAVLDNLASLYQDMGNYVKAEPLDQRALRIREKVLGPEDPHTATSLNNLGSLYKEMGDYARAESFYQRSVAIQEKVSGPQHPETATSLSNLATLYAVIGDYKKAKPLFERALAIRETVFGPDNAASASVEDALAQLYHRAGDYGNAERLYQRALAIYEKSLGANHPDTTLTVNNLAELYEAQGKYGKAESLLQRVVISNEKVFGPDHPNTAFGLHNLAQVYHHLGDFAKAESYYKRALAIREKTLGVDHPDTAVSVYNLAVLELDIGNITEARSLAVRSAAAQVTVLSKILSFCSERQRLAYQDKCAPYTLFSAIAGSDAELATACLRFKGVVLDSMIEDRVLAEAGGIKENREMVETLNSDKQELGQLLLERPKVAMNHTAEDIRQLEQEAELIEGKLARHVFGSGQTRRALGITAEQVQAVIPSDGALIEYLRYPHYLGKGRFEPWYGAIVLTAKEKPRWVPLGKADEIEQGVRRYRDQINDRDTAEHTLEETLRVSFQQLWAPVEQVLPKNTRTVIISPDAQLNFVSFATLLTAGNRFLAEDHAIQYVASGRDLLRETKLAPNSQLIAFGDPDFGVEPIPGKELQAGAQQVAFRGKTREALEELELPALPGTKAECAMLAEKCKQWGWQGSRFLSTEASEAQLRRVKSPHILHLATHGFFVDVKKEDLAQLGSGFADQSNKAQYFENPMHRAGLALAGAEATLEAWRRGETPPTENDGIVTAEEVSSLNLEGTWLVTLSACNTGTGEAKSGEGVLGLRRGFVQAGAQNLLMTLWPISDETTVDIMADFYEAAHQSGNAPQALAEVQRDWLVKLRKTKGLVQAVDLAGPFILSSQGKPEMGASK